MKLHAKSALEVLIFASTMAALACNNAPPPEQPDMRASDEAAIRKTDANWAQSAQTKQADLWVAYYTDDAVVLPPNDKTATSKESIHKIIEDLLSLPGLTIQWHLTKVEVARSGDIAYGYGTYELSYTGPKGKPVTDTGKVLETWRKQPNGEWKCSVDTWNSDLPAGPTSK